MLLLVISIMYLVSVCVFSLILMKDEIMFSGAVFMYFISFPLIFYAIAGSIFFFIFDRLPKFNQLIVKYLTMLMIASFIVSFPISFYVDYKLKSDGYFVCDKISWRSPTTYVKDLKLCN
ncbi:membrane protein [Xenorhabdus beddingii]|uniref:Membrane protein n=1 Tax=Xenorhabdus beddingii TaxID=40578 RepID=A0A1Y2SJD3_9GAMM|nr:membrane protein [Xenorhabdus beddingii]